ncbi:MAG: acylphosphatase [Gammaproteobacteria bacterium]|nr:acylphosphatase [Gammaproteobacteria bacterium]
MTYCVKCLVSGKVQGVWFRGNTQNQAQQLGLTGYVHNLPDGRVEVLACGNAENLRILQDWLWQGPRLAEVTDVHCEPATINPLPGEFTTG